MFDVHCVMNYIFLAIKIMSKKEFTQLDMNPEKTFVELGKGHVWNFRC